MARCPSEDWDRYCFEQDRTAAAQAAWYKANQAHLIQVVCALIGEGQLFPVAELPDTTWKEAVKELVDTAAEIVLEVTHRGEYE